MHRTFYLRKDLTKKDLASFPPVERIFTINGYSDDKGEDAFDRNFEFHNYIFIVWGWMTSKGSWDRYIKNNFAIKSWDYNMENIKQKYNLISLTPYFSHVKNIGNIVRMHKT